MFHLFRPRPTQLAGQRLHAAAVARARAPDLYIALGAPDTPAGRFELLSAHVYLLLARLKGQGPAATDTAQALFDTYVRGLDNALRELGVGDLSVGKKMRKLGEAFYGRIGAYEAAIAALPDETPLQDALRRTVYEGDAGIDPAPLAARLLAERAALAARPLEDLLAGEAGWPAP
ncbi:ubiquinol-cytochrome C chaperone family protein [Phenylobacterium sp.]|jgi:cytochrome b pre-mRNA-processing protein 3|uniref:ubiquinol-cytochrome C chaperone family protein n=1 Tax=Phenylobacterium sp. TaxID=1871053 RepID=UPI0037CBE8ED